MAARIAADSSGSVASLCAGRPDEMGFHLVQTTGSVEHLDALAQRAESRGLSWTAAGLTSNTSKIRCTTEEDVYAALELQWIPPELREGQGEIEAAAEGKLPRLVEPGDICGFLHCHSNYSDGTSTVRDWALAAQEAGYEYLGITDHSEAARYAGGLFRDKIQDLMSQIPVEGSSS